MAGYFATSKKSGLRRCSSRFASPVSIDAVSIDASTTARVGSFSSATAVAVNFGNFPFTVLIMRWRTPNWMLECAGSISQVEVVCASAGAARAASRTSVDRSTMGSLLGRGSMYASATLRKQRRQVVQERTDLLGIPEHQLGERLAGRHDDGDADPVAAERREGRLVRQVVAEVDADAGRRHALE